MTSTPTFAHQPSALRRLLAAVAALGVAAVVASPPASAQGAEPTTSTTTAVPAPVVPSAEALRTRYASLSGALLSHYAASAGQTVGQFTLANPEVAPSLLGTMPTDGAKSLGALNGSDVTTVNAQLLALGAAVDTGSYSDLAAYAKQLQANAGSADAQVVAAGASWVQRMGELRTPALSTPKAPALPKSVSAGMPREGLMFGLFLDKSLTALVADHPDVFSQIRRSGLGTPAAKAAWDTSMRNAYTASRPDFATMLPSPCGGVLLSVMASGDPAGGAKIRPKGASCSPCVAGGMYLHSQMSRLFDPKVGATIPNIQDNLLPPTELNSLPGWQRDILSQQNPGLASKLDSSLRKNSPVSDCSGAGTATTGALNTTLPGVFSRLTR